MEEDQLPTSKTFAERLDHLFLHEHPHTRGPFSPREVADAINQAAGEAIISHSYIWQLRTGKKDNPTRTHIQALAAFFKVSPLYFFDDEDGEQAEPALKRALRDTEVRDTALLAAGLSQQTLQTIKDMLARARTLEGLPGIDEAGDAPASPALPGD